MDVNKIAENRYEISGKLIEVTSVELESGGSVAEHPIMITLKRMEDRWLIDKVDVGDDQQNKYIQYENTEFSFRFTLPSSWEGFQIVKQEWRGTSLDKVKADEYGPQLLIRHPKWAKGNVRQVIPIMILSKSQWDSLQKSEFHIGAAPIGPKVFDHNRKYVFALPARYNFAFPEGYQEVEEIMKKNPLKAIETD